jgi:hypothetical protein
MADLYSVAAAVDNAGATTVTIGANARKAENNFSRFGTRKLSFHKITGCTGVGTNPGNANSVFHKATSGVAQVAELFYANAVATDVLIIGIAEDNNNGAGVGNTANDKTIKEAIDESAFAGTPTVTVGAADTAVFQAS